MTKHNVKVATVILVALASALAQAENVTIKIGSSNPLTGAGAVEGKDAENGLRMAIEDINKKGVTIEGRSVNFVLDSQDDQGDPRVGVQVAQKLVDDGVDVVIGPFYSGVTIPASAIYSKANIPILTTATNPTVTTLGHDNLFQINPSDARLGGEMAKYASSALKAKKAAIIDDRTAYGEGVADEFEKVAKQTGISVVEREYTNDKASDFKGILTKIRGNMPDVIFFGGYSQQAGLLIKQMHAIGINAILLGGDSVCSVNTGTLGGPDSESVRCPIGGTTLSATSAGIKFTKDYQSRFGVQPQLYAAVYYDAMYMFVDALSKAGGVQPEPLIKALHAIDYKGIAGQYSFMKSGELANPTITIYGFKGGQLVPVVR